MGDEDPLGIMPPKGDAIDEAIDEAIAATNGEGDGLPMVSFTAALSGDPNRPAVMSFPADISDGEVVSLVWATINAVGQLRRQQEAAKGPKLDLVQPPAGWRPDR